MQNLQAIHNVQYNKYRDFRDIYAALIALTLDGLNGVVMVEDMPHKEFVELMNEIREKYGNRQTRKKRGFKHTFSISATKSKNDHIVVSYDANKGSSYHELQLFIRFNPRRLTKKTIRHFKKVFTEYFGVEFLHWMWDDMDVKEAHYAADRAGVSLKDYCIAYPYSKHYRSWSHVRDGLVSIELGKGRRGIGLFIYRKDIETFERIKKIFAKRKASPLSRKKFQSKLDEISLEEGSSECSLPPTDPTSIVRVEARVKNKGIRGLKGVAVYPAFKRVKAIPILKLQERYGPFIEDSIYLHGYTGIRKKMEQNEWRRFKRFAEKHDEFDLLFPNIQEEIKQASKILKLFKP